MAYNGYLVKIGNYTLPHKYILMGSYKAPYHMQDLDPKRDTNGSLYRNVLDHAAPACSWQLRKGLTNLQYEEIMSNIRRNYTIPKERKATVTCFIPELNGYVTDSMYLVEPNPTILKEENSSLLIYDAIDMEFVCY